MVQAGLEKETVVFPPVQLTETFLTIFSWPGLARCGRKDLINTLIFTLISVPLTEARRRKIALESDDCRRASSRGLIPKAKVKTIKMTFVIVFGKFSCLRLEWICQFHIL